MARNRRRLSLLIALLAIGATACKEEKPAAPIATRYIQGLYARDAAAVFAELCEGEQAQLPIERLNANFAEPFDGAVLGQSRVIGQASELFHSGEAWVMFDVETPDLDTLWVGYQPTFHQEIRPDGSTVNVIDDPLAAGAARIAEGKLATKSGREAVHLRRHDTRGWCVIDERTRLGLYEKSRQLAAVGDYEGAIARLEEVRALDPKAKLIDMQVERLRKKAAEAAANPPPPPAAPDGAAVPSPTDAPAAAPAPTAPGAAP